MVAEHPGFHFQRCVLTQPQHIQLVFAYINANKCHLSIPPLVYAASSRLGRARIPYRLRERSEPDLRRRVIALRSATGFRPTKVLVANQHSGRDTRSTRLGCECVLDRFAPGAVLLQMNLPPPRIVGAPAPGANMCRTGSHRGGAPTATLPAPRIVGAPAPGANELFPCGGLR